jgi:hypothetical protein
LRRIVSPLYTNYEHFAKLPKPAEYRAFFVMRDPRDLVVSHYFSSRYSHVVQEGVLEERSRLEGLSEREGMLVHMRYMAERGIFEAIRSWVAAEHEGERVRVVRFEDLVGAEQLQHVLDLLRFCDIATPEHKVVALLERLSFAKLSGGRKQGQENKHHKYRSGKAGDWKKYFDDEMLDVYHSLDQGLSQVLNYA